MEGDSGYQDQNIISNEKLFKVEGSMFQTVVHRSIGALTFLNKNKRLTIGSGALISRNLVLTSAHNIYDSRYKCQISEFKFYLGANGVTKDFYEIEGWRYLQDYKTSSNNGNFKFDYALLKLKKDVQNKNFLFLSIPCDVCLMLQNKSTCLQIFGYPEKYVLANDRYGRQLNLSQYGQARDSRIVTVDSSAFKIGYGISTLPGQSGCPVVVGDRIIAIHKGGKHFQQFNVGRLITVDLHHNLQQWTKELKAQNFSIKQDVCSHIKDNMFINIYRYHAVQSDGWRFNYLTNPQHGKGWIYDGLAFRVPHQGVEGVVPVFQFSCDQSKTYGGRRYLYSISEIHKTYGWTLNGIAFYAFDEQLPETIPFYQHLCHQDDGLRFFLSQNQNEIQGWINDGVQFWAYPGDLQ